jgi:hypothetical protein
MNYTQEGRHSERDPLEKWSSIDIRLKNEPLSFEIQQSPGSHSHSQQSQLEPQTTKMPNRIRFKTAMHERRYAIAALVLSLSMIFFDIWESMMLSFDGILRSTNTYFDNEFRGALMMNEDSIPGYLVASTVLSGIICFVTMIFAVYETKRGFSVYLQLCRICLLLFVTALVLQIWAYSGAFPESKQQEVKAAMLTELLGTKGLEESAEWRNTQSQYECCGIDSFEDWKKRSSPTVDNGDAIVPQSCCPYVPITERYSKEDIQSDLTPAIGLAQLRTLKFKCTEKSAFRVGCVEKIISDMNCGCIHSIIVYCVLLIFHVILLRMMEHGFAKTILKA